MNYPTYSYPPIYFQASQIIMENIARPLPVHLQGELA